MSYRNSWARLGDSSQKYIRGKQGKRCLLTGRKVRSNRERGAGLLVAISRPYELGRAPLYLGAPALICWSGRPKPIFIPPKHHSWESRASGGFHALSTDVDDRPYKDFLAESRFSPLRISNAIPSVFPGIIIYHFVDAKLRLFCDIACYSSQNHAECPRNLDYSPAIRNFAVAMRTNL